MPTGTARPQFIEAQRLRNHGDAGNVSGGPGARKSTRSQNSAKVLAADLTQRAEKLEQNDNIVETQEGQVNTTSGAKTPRNANYQWDEAGGAYVDLTGGHPPVTPPSPRVTNVAGVGALQSKAGWRGRPGGAGHTKASPGGVGRGSAED